MASLLDLQQRGETTRKCKAECGLEKPIDQFRIKRQRGYETVTHVCIECSRARSRAHYEAHRGDYIARVAKWKADNPERVKSYQTSEKYRDKRRAEYANDPERRRRAHQRAQDWYNRNADVAIQRAADWRRRHPARARKHARESSARSRSRQTHLVSIKRIPAPVIRTYLEQMLREASVHTVQEGRKEQFRGGKVLSEWTGIPERRIFGIMSGEAKSVSFDVLDRLLAHSDYTIVEVLDAAKEWAAIQGIVWP